MATATTKVKKTKVKKMVEVEVVEKTITLTLTEAEATTIMLLFSKTGGSPSNGPRQYMDNIGYALRDAGFDYPLNYKEYFTPESAIAGIYFSDKNFPEKE